MNKYIDADRLRAEIERLKETHERNLDKPMERGRIGYAHGCVDCCDEILSFIDSIQQAQPEVDLDALVDEAFDKYSSVDGYGQLSVSFNRAELYWFIEKIARKEK